MTSAKTRRTLQKRGSQLEEQLEMLQAENLQLRYEQKHLRTLINASHDPIVISDVHSKITRVNNAYCELLGYSQQELIGNYAYRFHITEGAYTCTTGETVIIDEEYMRKQQADFHTFVSDGGIGNFYTYYRHRDGRAVPVMQNISFLKDDNGDLAGACAIIHNLTDLKKSERELEHKNRQFERFIDSSLDPIAITDNAGRIIRTNEAFCSMLGYHGDYVLGKNFYELSVSEPGVYESMSGETVSMGKDFFNENRSRIVQLFSHGRVSNWNFYYVHRTGKIVPVIQNIVFQTDARSAYTISFAIIKDMTEQRRAEHRIERARGFLQNIFDAAGDAIFVTDMNGALVMVNKAFAAMTGYAEGELKGSFIFDMLYAGQTAAPRAPHMPAQLSEHGDLSRYETVFQCKNGSGVPVEVNQTLLRENNGTHAGIVAFARDITARRQVEELLQQSQDKLELMVKERTSELEDVNTALRVLLKKRDEDKRSLEEAMHSNIRDYIVPSLERLRGCGLSGRAQACLDALDMNFSEIARPLLKRKSLGYFKLTATEIEIVNQIRREKSTREIALMTALSPRTIERHRDNIRKKLGLSHKKINLTTYLMSIA